MIGSYSFDLLSVYTKNDEHELWRVWVGLTDTEENNEEVAAQGFLKMSCTVIGPNDPIPIHDPEQDAKDEAEREKVMKCANESVHRENFTNYYLES